jgi:hypothetical protein
LRNVTEGSRDHEVVRTFMGQIRLGKMSMVALKLVESRARRSS